MPKEEIDALLGDSGSEEESSESEDAASDILEAISDGDAASLDLALKRHYELCKSSKKSAKKEEAY